MVSSIWATIFSSVLGSHPPARDCFQSPHFHLNHSKNRPRTHQIQPLLLLGETPKHLLDLLQVPQITPDPLNLCLRALLLDLTDRLVPLLLLPVDHDDARAGLGERTGDLVPDAEGSAGDEGDATEEGGGDADFGADERGEDGLHG